VPGLFVATGHEGEGITLAPITGKLVADAILGTGKEELERFLPSRFAFGSQPDAAEYRKGEKQ
jgi:glycine/D-amino acid oxidase-like deaminating enzyme